MCTSAQTVGTTLSTSYTDRGSVSAEEDVHAFLASID